jgi:hypothetical protein
MERLDLRDVPDSIYDTLAGFSSLPARMSFQVSVALAPIRRYSTACSTGTDRLLSKNSASQFIAPSAPSVARDAHAAPCHE